MKKVLFICTHNRCRSQLFQALANHLGDGKVEAQSAGSQPQGIVHPGAIAALKRHGIATDDLSSKSWDDLADFEPDLIVTVCDSAAGEVCPVWFGDTEKQHWSTPDPSIVEGEAEQVIAFDKTIEAIKQRLDESGLLS